MYIKIYYSAFLWSIKDCFDQNQRLRGGKKDRKERERNKDKKGEKHKMETLRITWEKVRYSQSEWGQESGNKEGRKVESPASFTFAAQESGLTQNLALHLPPSSLMLPKAQEVNL